MGDEDDDDPLGGPTDPEADGVDVEDELEVDELEVDDLQVDEDDVVDIDDVGGNDGPARWRTRATARIRAAAPQRRLIAAVGVSLLLVGSVLLLRPHPAGQHDLETVNPTTTTATPAPTEAAAPPLPVEGASSKALTAPTTAPPATAPPETAPPSYQPSSGLLAGGEVSIPYLGDVLEVSSADQWDSALAAAGPGDVIKLVADIRQPLQYWGTRFRPEDSNGPEGTAAAPITITAAPGVWIDPGNQSNNKPALDIMYTTNVNVIGVRVRNSQFGIRVLQSSGTPESPILIANNTVTDIGHAGIHVGFNFDTREPSRNVRIVNNSVSRTGLIAPEFGEGVYLGYGSQEWIDQSSNIDVVGNEISFVTAEAVDIKPGVKHVLVEDNLIHDLSPLRGGAVTASYVASGPNPDPGTPIDLLVRRNRIWNVNLDGRSGSNDWAIWVGHGGVTIEDNMVWGLRGNGGSTRAVRVRAPFDFGPHPITIRNNTFWTAAGWVAEGEPSGAGLVRASGNRGPAGAAGIEQPMGQPGAAPALGSGGTADRGSGPGSAFN